MMKGLDQKNKNTGVSKNSHWAEKLKLKETATNLKKKIIPFVFILCGTITQSFGAQEAELTQIWQGGEERPQALRMNTMPGFERVSGYWHVEPSLHSSEGQLIYDITGFPGAPRQNGSERDYAAYRPLFAAGYHVNTLILTRSGQPDFLDDFWTPNGFSSHAIIAQDGTILIHANLLRNEKGQMAGIWNSRSLEVAFIDQGNQECAPEQQAALKNLLAIVHTGQNCKVRYGGSFWDAKQVQRIDPQEFVSGKVENIDGVLAGLDLLPLRDFFQSPEDIMNKVEKVDEGKAEEQQD
ncbi:MAG: hypothetical protein K0R52_327 [Alphaproteobacteria bacterium]|jgi:hypothetical protein|nr:hypothetical protein [Alphaproteobacteria bacterium]